MARAVSGQHIRVAPRARCFATCEAMRMARGFEYFAHEAARTIGDRLEHDLWRARGGW